MNNGYREFDFDALMENRWGDWEKKTTEYLNSHGISVDRYQLGYHEGCPTVYWDDTAICIWGDPTKLYSRIEEIRGS